MPDRHRPKHWPKSSYDPRYDPIVDAGPGHNRDYAPTYWIGTAIVSNRPSLGTV